MKKEKMTLVALILMIFTSVFGFNNIPRAFFLMGYSAIPWYLFGGLAFFLPYAFMMAEFGSTYKEEKGIYAWMEKSVNPKFAFVGTFLWFSSYIIWMVSVSSSIWIPLSNLLFGYDATSDWSLFGLNAPKTLGVLGVILVLIITYLSSKGLKNISKIASIGGFFVTSANVVLIVGSLIVFIGNRFKPLEPINFSSFFISPRGDYRSLLAILSFLVYAIFAYGGLEAVGGLVDQTKDAERNFPKGIKISAIIIAVGYSIGILMIGLFTNYEAILNNPKISRANVSYVVIKNLGIQLGKVFGLSNNTSNIMGTWFARYIGLAMFLALLGAFFTLIYSPLKQVIEGTPIEIWPKSLTKLSSNEMPVNAMYIQFIIVSIIIILASFGGDTASVFLDYLIAASNVSMTVPSIFLAIAFIYFKKNDNIKKSFIIFKNKSFAYFCAIVVIFTVSFANIFTIVQPAIEEKDYISTIFQVAGPIIFVIIALFLFNNYEKKIKDN